MSTTFGTLTTDEIENLLTRSPVGRIGCHTRERPYIVPVSYAYDGACVYGYASDGLKLEIMRFNPLVCFEVDEVRTASQWESVIAFGRFEELDGARAGEALDLISHRMRASAGFLPGSPDPSRTVVTRRGRYGVAYRIVLTEKSGRFERREALETPSL